MGALWERKYNDSGRSRGRYCGRMNPDEMLNMNQTPAESLAVIAAVMVELLRRVERMERLLAEIMAVTDAAVEDMNVIVGVDPALDEGMMDTQSVMKRSWDAHGARWVYGPPQ